MQTQQLPSLSGNARGVLWAISAAFFLTAMLTLIKTLGQTAHVVQILFIRQAVMLIVALPVIAREYPACLISEKLGLHFLRVALATAAMGFTFFAVIHLPLADATTLGFSRALFITLFAIVILSEIVDWRRWLALIVGFVGVLIMLRPGADGFDIYALCVVAGAACAAGVSILLRILSRTDRPITILTYQAVLIGLLTAPIAFYVWVPLTALQWGMAIGIGIAAAAGQMSNIRAFRSGEASVIAPIEYTKLIWATLLGFVLFSTLPDLNTLLGAAIIILASLFVFYGEMRKPNRTS